jgi:YVTN family beta-propeller protein
VIKSIIVGKAPNGITVHPSGKYVYTANQTDKNVTVIDAVKNIKLTDIKGPGMRPYALATNPAGTKLYVSNCCCGYTGSVINTATHKFINTIDVGDSPIAFGQFVK